MTYITLGSPQQKQIYVNTKYLQPMEIWFYQDPGSALAPYFSVIFFKPSPAEDYRIYSPYQDRPEKLIASNNAVNDEKKALRIIKDQLSDEVANLTLSLLPNEPVDTKEAYPGLESDSLLNRLRNYRNLPETKSILAYRRALLEGVTHRVLLGQDFSDLTVMATRDGANQASVHYVLRLLNAGDFYWEKMLSVVFTMRFRWRPSSWVQTVSPFTRTSRNCTTISPPSKSRSFDRGPWRLAVGSPPFPVNTSCTSM